MIKRIEYPRIPDGSTSPQLKNELRKLVDQINAAISDIEQTMDISKGGKVSGT